MMDFAQYDTAAQRTGRWATDLLCSEGFRDCPPTVLAYYKAPVGMLATGHARSAGQAMHTVERFFFRNGDFHAAEQTPSAGRSYRNGWLAWGAHLLGAYHLSEPALDRLEASLDAQTGGSPDDDTVDLSQRIYPAGGTASVANALLAGGRVDAAIRAGLFLKDLFDSQSANAGRVLLNRDAQGTLVDPDRLGIVAGVESMVFDLGKPGQICWIFGFSLRMFARLFRATGDRGWLDSAEHLHGWILRAHPSLYANVTNAKVAWGAAEMYGATGQQEWLDLSRKIGEWVIAQQDDSGVWVRRPQYSDATEQPLPVSLDTSIERMYYMVDIPRALSLAPASR